MTRRAFTLIEMVVSLGILALILSFAGVIFRVSIDAQRMAMANAEIMQKLRIITEQLDADFRGGVLQYGGYLSTQTNTYTVEDKSISTNSDALALFTCGDFRSTNQYRRTTGGSATTVAGNVAFVVYCQPDPSSYTRPPAPRERVLLRRQTILAFSPAGSADTSSNQGGEYYPAALQQWMVNPPHQNDPNLWIVRPVVEPNNVRANLPMYLAKGVDNFTIQYVADDSVWKTSETIPWLRPTSTTETSSVKPKAFKFTFTLYDSRGYIKKGREFTHIVVWDRYEPKS